MKAAVYGRDIRIQEVAKPVPKENEVLVRVHAVDQVILEKKRQRRNPELAMADVGEDGAGYFQI